MPASQLLTFVKSAVTGLWHTIFPPLCLGCGSVLQTGERGICTGCCLELAHLTPKDDTDSLLRAAPYRLMCHFGHFAYAYLYNGSHPLSDILKGMKYRHDRRLCHTMGMFMANEQQISRVLKDIDYLIPVPLHPKRLKERGYNQAEMLCRGMGEVSGVPCLTDVLRRTRHIRNQATKSAEDRKTEIAGIFEAVDTSAIEGKHIAIVDDVITTGATTQECVLAVRHVPGLTISIITMCMTESL